ncbi:glycosyltransferase family 61 protein [Diaporthe eres]|uniref:EGF domain-specific O-linked N-acetylglucosamine transferase n=1 Tax=Diaporthe vaccinii TaxID=105482 RepID=A0ABR4ET79_9PEZI|nr:glycosyltransferase family 61 protein [Diaporthe eres]
MATGLTSTKCKYSLILACICLGLVLYHIYWADGIPSYSWGSQSSLPTSQISKAEDVVEFEPQNPKASSTAASTLPPAPTLPPEYSALTEGQQKCDLFFTTDYLEHTATHQQPYCDAQSPSAFQCFTAPRLVVPPTASWGQTDPLCIAQGVSFEPAQAGEARDSEAEEFEIQCKLRDIAGERASSAEAAKDLEGFRDRPTDWGWYWGDTGVGASLNTWRFSDDRNASGCTRENSNNEWVMLMRRDSTDTHNLWHKLMEILQARHSLDALRIAINPTTGAPWLSEQDAANVQLVFDDDREELLEPLWEIVTGRKPIRKSSLRATCFGNVILPLPGCGSPFWSHLLDTGYQEHCPSQTLLTTFVNRVFGFYGIVPRPVTEIHANPTITIVQRKKNRKFMSLDRWVPILKERYPQATIDVVDFADISVEEQLRLVQSTDILMGHHGAALTHTIFLSPESTVVEILPRYFDQHGFRATAALRGVQYIAGRGRYEEEYENAVHGTPLPQDWPPPPPQGFNHFQQQEWVYLTDEDFLGLVDAAVRTQLNRLTSSNL